MPDAIRKILVVRLSSLGDIVHSLPGVAALRDAAPDAHIDWLVARVWAPILDGCPAADRLILFDQAPATGIFRKIGELRAEHYDVAVDFQGLYKSALLTLFSGAARRVGFDRLSAREPGAAIFYNDRVRAGGPHRVRKNLSLSERLGAPRDAEPRFPFRVSDAAIQSVRERLAAQGIENYWVALPGGGWAGKLWPAGHYGALCRAIEQRLGLRALLIGGSGEEKLAEAAISAAGPTAPIRFPTTLAELMAVLAHARFVVGGDTGPLHLAAALGVPVVGLYGPTDPAQTGPYTKKSVIVRNARPEETSYRFSASPSRAMLSISVEQAIAAVEQLQVLAA
ncbi:MAG: lipopolysaccharide heptosyltransferase I [Candidatus Acidiferrales bacterium]